VNVASKCGLTPQYEDSRICRSVLRTELLGCGFPCNQFAGQEPGTAEEIQTFCSTTYGVTFPLFEKVEVNGPDQSPIYAELEKVSDEDGYSATCAGT